MDKLAASKLSAALEIHLPQGVGLATLETAVGLRPPRILLDKPIVQQDRKDGGSC